jgi:hypothetical protein
MKMYTLHIKVLGVRIAGLFSSKSHLAYVNVLIIFIFQVKKTTQYFTTVVIKEAQIISWLHSRSSSRLSKSGCRKFD